MKKVLAVSLVAAITLSAALPASADSGTVEIKNDVKAAHILCAVPMETKFAVDAFQKEETNGQIWSPSYAFINKSDVALRVSVKPTVTGKSGVTVVGAPSAVPKTGGTKNAYLELVPATTATVKVTQQGAVVSDTLKTPVLSATAFVAADGSLYTEVLSLSTAHLSSRLDIFFAFFFHVSILPFSLLFVNTGSNSRLLALAVSAQH